MPIGLAGIELTPLGSSSCVSRSSPRCPSEPTPLGCPRPDPEHDLKLLLAVGWSVRRERHLAALVGIGVSLVSFGLCPRMHHLRQLLHLRHPRRMVQRGELALRMREHSSLMRVGTSMLTLCTPGFRSPNDLFRALHREARIYTDLPDIRAGRIWLTSCWLGRHSLCAPGWLRMHSLASPQRGQGRRPRSRRRLFDRSSWRHSSWIDLTMEMAVFNPLCTRCTDFANSAGKDRYPEGAEALNEQGSRCGLS